jgi:hypothetical protein
MTGAKKYVTDRSLDGFRHTKQCRDYKITSLVVGKGFDLGARKGW